MKVKKKKQEKTLFFIIKPLSFQRRRKLCMYGKNTVVHNTPWPLTLAFQEAFSGFKRSGDLTAPTECRMCVLWVRNQDHGVIPQSHRGNPARNISGLVSVWFWLKFLSMYIQKSLTVAKLFLPFFFFLFNFLHLIYESGLPGLWGGSGVSMPAAWPCKPEDLCSIPRTYVSGGKEPTPQSDPRLSTLPHTLPHVHKHK